MGNYIKKLNPVNPNLIFGKSYLCFRKGEKIGVYVWINDINIKSSFQRWNSKDQVIEVCFPDMWELLN